MTLFTAFRRTKTLVVAQLGAPQGVADVPAFPVPFRFERLLRLRTAACGGANAPRSFT